MEKTSVSSATTRLWHRRNELVQSFHISTIHGMINTWNRCNFLKKTPQEPDFVAGFVLDSTPLILSALNSALSPHRISVSTCAVFCHQTPLVAFGAPKSASCEVGDILFAYVHTTKTGETRRNALLFQAKASSKQPYPIKKSEKDQLRLYMDWPDFQYTRSSLLNGQKRVVTPKAPHAGAQYLLIDNRPPHDPKSGLLGLPGTYPVGCCMPNEILFDHSQFASELFNFLTFQTGRPFSDKHMARVKQDWSQVVWDLLETGVRKLFNRKNSGRRNAPRSAGDTIEMLDGMSFCRATPRSSFMTVSEIVGEPVASTLYEQNSDIPPIDFNEQEGDELPESGVSIVLIEVSELENED